VTNEAGSTSPVDWRHSARCRDEDPEALFVQGARQRDARDVCRACPVRTECLAHALDNRIRFGVWGGMTERERRALLRRRPDVVSWSALLESARRDAVRRHVAARAAATDSATTHASTPAPSTPAPSTPAAPAEASGAERPGGSGSRRAG